VFTPFCDAPQVFFDLPACVTNLTVEQPSLDGVTHSPEERGIH
jgi:hypothetical protein